MTAIGQDTLKTRRTLNVEGKAYDYYSLPEAAKSLGDISRLPVSLKVLLENLVRNEDGATVKKEDIAAFADWLKNGGKSTKEINFRPARVLMQDFTVSEAGRHQITWVDPPLRRHTDSPLGPRHPASHRRTSTR